MCWAEELKVEKGSDGYKREEEASEKVNELSDDRESRERTETGGVEWGLE